MGEEAHSPGDGQLNFWRFSILLFPVLLTGCLTAPGMFVGTDRQQTSGKWLFLGPKVDVGAAASTVALPISATTSTPSYRIVAVSNESIAATTTPHRTHTLPSQPSVNPPSAAYIIGAQDILRIDVWGHPDLGSGPQANAATSSTPASGRVVDENGHVFIPLIGTTRAAGFTPSQLRENIASAMAKYIRSPQVEVSVVAYRSKRVLVAGEVKSPGLLSLTDVQFRLSEAIANAGGVTSEADISEIALIRNGIRYSINLHRVLYEGDSSANLILLPNDSISVPDRSSRKVFVMGELLQPRTQMLRYGRVTLAEVLSDAGGLNPLTSNSGEVFVIRADDQDGAIVYQLNAREPAALILADRFQIRPRDTVYINPTNLTRIGRIVAQLLPTLTGATAVRSIAGN